MDARVIGHVLGPSLGASRFADVRRAGAGAGARIQPKQAAARWVRRHQVSKQLVPVGLQRASLAACECSRICSEADVRHGYGGGKPRCAAESRSPRNTPLSVSFRSHFFRLLR